MRKYYYALASFDEHIKIYWVKSFSKRYAKFKLIKYIRRKHRPTGYEPPLKFIMYRYCKEEKPILIYKEMSLW